MAFKNIATICFLLGAIALMVKLGLWQVQRLEWKEAIIADIEAQEAIDPATVQLDLDADLPNFSMGYVEGTFYTNVISIQPRTQDGKIGKHIYTIIKTTDNQYLAVNLGWIAIEEKPIWAGLVPRRFAGYLRTPDKAGTFTPSNMPGINQWYAYDADDFMEYYKIGQPYDKVLYLTSPLPSTNIQAFNGLPHPRNKHAQYAAFWFGMAGLLAFLSCFYTWKRKQQNDK